MDIRHVDISVANVMWDRGRDKGVLNDFDLAKPVSQITRTLPFIPLDLLDEDGVNGLVPPLYRHQFESFTWVPIYLCYAMTKTGDDFGLRVKGLIKEWLGSPLYPARFSQPS